MYDLPYDQDINKYSIYVHLQPEWRSHPGNILFDVTTVWSNHEDATVTYDYEEVSGAVHNFNELEHLGEKSFVRLSHQYSDCQTSWRPILYRLALDTIGNQIEYYQGLELNGDPYVSIYPDVAASQNLDSRSGFIQFLPICTIQNGTSYQYSIKVNGDAQFDAYFVPSEDEVLDYIRGVDFEHHQQEGCYAEGYHSASGVCENISSDAGLLIAIPDNLSTSLTRVEVTLHEIEA